MAHLLWYENSRDGHDELVRHAGGGENGSTDNLEGEKGRESVAANKEGKEGLAYKLR